MASILELEQLAVSKDQPSHVVVFVHGIRSSHITFQALADKLANKCANQNLVFTYFDYNYRRSMAENGLTFANQLERALAQANAEVSIVAHSMGGLVSRLALLQRGDQLPFVKRLIMLGTPNHGTLHTARHGLLASLVMELTGKIWAVTTAKTGVLELTQVNKVIDQYLTDESQRRTRHVDYFSIPATFFNENTGWLEAMTSSASRAIGLAPLAMELLRASPFAMVKMEMPHDGIVEESSVSLSNRREVTRRSERRQTCSGCLDCGPYLHIRHDELRKENHVTLQSSEQAALIIASILKVGNMTAWRASNVNSFGFDLEPKI